MLKSGILLLCSPGNPGFYSLEGVSFWVDPNVKTQKVRIKPGDWVLGAVETFHAGNVPVTDSDAAYVGEILQA